MSLPCLNASSVNAELHLPFQSQRKSWGEEGEGTVQFGELTPTSLPLHVHHAAASKA